MKPIGKNILVIPINEQAVTQIGIILSKKDTEQLRYKRAVISKVGDEVTPLIKEGDTVHYDTRAGYSMLINGSPFTLITETQIVVVE